MKHVASFLLGAFVIVACGSAPKDVIERTLKLGDTIETSKLLGPKAEQDKPLSWCKEAHCYVYEDAAVRRIKKYIVELEEDLKACQEGK